MPLVNKLRFNHSRPGHAGFTLFEVMIALAIIAIALTAAVRAASLGTDSAIALKARTLASWVAQNRLATHVALADWPGVGIHQGTENQAGVTLLWQEQVSVTPSPFFRRIEIDVYAQNDPQHRLNRLVGYLVNPPRPQPGKGK